MYNGAACIHYEIHSKTMFSIPAIIIIIINTSNHSSDQIIKHVLLYIQKRTHETQKKIGIIKTVRRICNIKFIIT